MTHLNNGAKKGACCLFAILAQQAAGQWKTLQIMHCTAQFEEIFLNLVMLPVTHLNSGAKKSICAQLLVYCSGAATASQRVVFFKLQFFGEV